jgi:hypothetical protein
MARKAGHVDLQVVFEVGNAMFMKAEFESPGLSDGLEKFSQEV